MAHEGGKKGVKSKLLGMSMIFLGLLDWMVTFRGGADVEGFHVFLVGSGVFLFFTGAVRRRRQILATETP